MVYVSCNMCGRDDWFVRFPATERMEELPETSAFRCTHSGYGSHTQIVQCRNCGHVFANPRWTEAELLTIYSSVEDELYVQERLGREKTFDQKLNALERWVTPADGRRVLDVGAYIGVFVERARSRGWDAIGVEPSRWAVDVAKSAGLPIFEGTLHSRELDEQGFDVITLWDVIEHLDNPTTDLERAYSLLKPGGIIAIHTMDIDSLAAKMMGSRWPWLMDMHLHYFSRRTLSQMLQKCGFDVLWIGSQGRYLSLGYLASRLRGLNEPLGHLLKRSVVRLRISQRLLPVNFGDLFTAIGRKPG